MSKNRRWNREPFLRAACDQMERALDWDSLDSGRLHHAASAARTLGGTPVVVAVVERPDALADAVADADVVREDEGLGAVPLWLYVPSSLDVSPVDAVVYRVDPAR